MAKSIAIRSRNQSLIMAPAAIHFFVFGDIFRCYRDNENLKQPFGRMDTLKRAQ